MDNMYEILRNRMMNGEPFVREKAIERINSLILDLTQEQIDELKIIAIQHGEESLPEDRLAALEKATEENTLMLAELIGGAI